MAGEKGGDRKALLKNRRPVMRAGYLPAVGKDGLSFDYRCNDVCSCQLKPLQSMHTSS